MELKKYKKKRITPQGWKEVTLADAFNTSSGATPLSTEASYYENGTIPWINSGELASPYIYGTTNFISQAGFENSSTEIYPIDTVLVAMYGATAGKASLLKMEACTNQAICAILPNKDYSSTFLDSIESNFSLAFSLGQTNTYNSFISLSERCPTVEPFVLVSLAFMYGCMSYFA